MLRYHIFPQQSTGAKHGLAAHLVDRGTQRWAHQPNTLKHRLVTFMRTGLLKATSGCAASKQSNARDAHDNVLVTNFPHHRRSLDLPNPPSE